MKNYCFACDNTGFRKVLFGEVETKCANCQPQFGRSKDALPDLPSLMSGAFNNPTDHARALLANARERGRLKHEADNKAFAAREYATITKPRCVILDIDGTVADNSHRAHLAPGKGSAGEPEDWAAWEAELHADKPIQHVIDLVKRYAAPFYPNWPVAIVVVTGRGSNCHAETMNWLRKQGIPFSLFFGRNSMDKRPSAVLKESILLNDVLPYFDVEMAFEDQSSCVAMFRSHGIPCLHVADGGF